MKPPSVQRRTIPSTQNIVDRSPGKYKKQRAHEMRGPFFRINKDKVKVHYNKETK